ncbi:MAG: YicC/YloC family endoribonuclease, partial [Jannaschia sp.]
MTGYAARDAEGRRWDLRSVNARGLDLRFRLPDLPAGLEPLAREMLASVVARGNVTLSLKVETQAAATPSLDPAGLERA